MAQAALGCALGYIDLRGGDRDWRAGRPAVASWVARLNERPSMLATRPD
jgi:glutathione S-transferase